MNGEPWVAIIAVHLAGYTLCALPAFYFAITLRRDPAPSVPIARSIAAYLLATKPLQLWLLAFDPFQDDARHIWALAIECFALAVILWRTGASSGRVAVGAVGVLFCGLMGFFLAGALDPFDLRSHLK